MHRPGETIHASRARRRRFVFTTVAALALAALLVYVFVFSRHGHLRRRELTRENERLRLELKELRAENARLREELTRLDDPRAVEKLAREKLGLVKEGEKVYRFLEKDEDRAHAKEKDPSPKP